MSSSASTRVMGLDLSTKAISMTTVEGDPTVVKLPPGVRSFEVGGDDRWWRQHDRELLRAARLRLPYLIDRTHAYLAESRPDLVIIEDTPFVKNRSGFAGLAMVVGAMAALCVVEGLEFRIVPGTVWKKGVGLKGTAAKPAIRTWANGTYPPSRDWSQDLCDAYGLGLYGWLGADED